ncbi:molybdopterin biosynthesis protein [Paramaledivibacter caminithermalis]|uniref:Molybdopterin molybdenumtransferase n=1 Tax=Paramaledivibacter caminithermalis (strain DSM 15212 / CIP 107654 / DViRD3) TaxID=1121301 RepID=A0A1M6KWG2_PARC5|nr:molybdopterin biosynthesis protein [Paramaledivibacter caminithermalis]SHJ63220.1 molybdopterin molybdochelatase [Paramaledivibacter caminithermalis DSM 15212]
MEKFERNIYLSNVELNEAKKLFFNEIKESLKFKRTEIVSVYDSLDRITAKPVFAKISSPFFNASAMDGIAVISKKTYGADERSPKRLKINEDFMYIDTGDVIKDPYDAVIMIEDVIPIDDETVEIIKAASPWQHVRPTGEDIVASEMIIPSYHKVTPVDIGAMLSGGILEIEVVRRPKVGIIPTGTEIIEPEDEIAPGKIIDSNSRMFEAMVKNYGGIPLRYKPVSDDYNLIRDKILQAIDENDIVIVNAGSSAGSEDYTSKIINEIGKLIVHGVAIKPGKPAILGNIKGKPIIGIPGYPVSAYIVFEAFVKPLMYEYQAIKETVPIRVEGVLSKRIMSSLKHLEYVRMKLGKVAGKLIATPLNRGAGVTMSLVKADGIAKIPKNVEGIEAGEVIEIELIKDIESINNTIVSIGSHDLIMDIIANMIHERYTDINLSSAHVGSLGGIMAIRRGEAHIAPIHLLDEGTGTYNIEYIKKYLKNKEVSLIKGVKRVQGLMVKKNNPKNITTIKDLTREDVVFVNRQKGSGTRILLDYKLKELNIDSSDIRGYDREMTTHMTVASAVLSETADVGLGILSSAQAMGLDFIPIGEEEYDFAIPSEFLEDEKVKKFIDILKSDDFAEKLMELGGYKIQKSGKIVRINN